MGFTLHLRTGPLADALLRTVQSSESASIANHSARTFFFAQLLAEHEGALDDAAYDRELLFSATVMHDLGAGDLAHRDARFEVEGADLAAALLTGRGVDAGVDRVWEAIALHTSPGIAERRGLFAYLTDEGVGIDFGRNAELVADWEKEIHGAYPRLAMAQSLTDAIVERAARSAAAAPRCRCPGNRLSVLRPECLYPSSGIRGLRRPHQQGIRFGLYRQESRKITATDVSRHARGYWRIKNTCHYDAIRGRR